MSRRACTNNTSALTMSMAEAVRYSGLSWYKLRRAIDSKAIDVRAVPGCQHPVVVRESLDRLLAPNAGTGVRELAGIRPI